MRRKQLSFAVAALSVAVAMAYLASLTMATKVTPPAKAVTATLEAKPGALFLFDNAESEFMVLCKKSTIKMKTPAEGANKENTNQKGVGKYSQSGGSVRIEITEAPSFTDCAYHKIIEIKDGALVVEEKEAATVTASTKNGAWSASAYGFGNEAVGHLFLNVPKEGITIKYGAVTKVLSAKGSSSVLARHSNKNHVFEVDGQLPVSEGGKDQPVLQFEADIYKVDENFEIKK